MEHHGTNALSLSFQGPGFLSSRSCCRDVASTGRRTSKRTLQPVPFALPQGPSLFGGPQGNERCKALLRNSGFNPHIATSVLRSNAPQVFPDIFKPSLSGTSRDISGRWSTPRASKVPHPTASWCRSGKPLRISWSCRRWTSAMRNFSACAKPLNCTSLRSLCLGCCSPRASATKVEPNMPNMKSQREQNQNHHTVSDQLNSYPRTSVTSPTVSKKTIHINRSGLRHRFQLRSSEVR